MVNGTFSGVGNKKTQNAQRADFDILFTQAKQQTESAEQQSGNRDESRDVRRERETRREEPVRRREHTPRCDDDTAEAGTAVIQQEQETVIADESAALEKVAEIMEVPVEIVVEWLDELELTAEDLTDTAAVTQILQHALDIESPSELLNDPIFPEKYKAVNEAMAEVAVNAKVKTESGETVKVSEEALELAEELEVNLEDGKIVVKSSSDETSLRNAAQTAQNETATVQAETNVTEESLVNESAAANETVSVNENAANETQAVSLETMAARAEQAVSRAVPQQPVNASNVIEQIMNQVKLTNAGENFTEIRITLRPETLGDIVLRVITQNGIVMAQFEAESQRVKEALEANFNQLRDALTEQGIKFSELSVSVRQEHDERMRQFEKARQASRNRAESIEEVSEEEISYHNGVIDVTA
jgi:flagellar hook-length control protein FliK